MSEVLPLSVVFTAQMLPHEGLRSLVLGRR